MPRFYELLDPVRFYYQRMLFVGAVFEQHELDLAAT
jgi:hypothetical protein